MDDSKWDGDGMKTKYVQGPWNIKIDLPTPYMTVNDLLYLLFAQLDYEMMVEVAKHMQTWYLDKDWPR